MQDRKGRPLRGLPERVYLRSQRLVSRKCRGTDEPLDVGGREQIEPGHPLGEGIDQFDERLVGDRTVDVAIPLGELAVEVLAADEGLECAGATDEARKAVDRPPAGAAPTPISNWPRTARSRLTKRMSVASANSLPAPRARPRIALIVTAGDSLRVELSPRLSLRRAKTACPEPTPANSLDRRSRNSEGFTRKNEEGREADFQLANRHLLVATRSAPARHRSPNETALRKTSANPRVFPLENRVSSQRRARERYLMNISLI